MFLFYRIDTIMGQRIIVGGFLGEFRSFGARFRSFGARFRMLASIDVINIRVLPAITKYFTKALIYLILEQIYIKCVTQLF